MAFLELDKQLHFELYRFQILPITTLNLFYGRNSQFNNVKDLIDNKNKILKDVLVSDELTFQGRKSKVIHKLETTNEGLVLMKLGTEKDIEIGTIELTNEEIESYPYCIVLINLDDQEQMIYVQRNFKAFTTTQVVAHIIERSLNTFLRQDGLVLYIEPVFDSHKFWQLIQQYHGLITRLRFEFIKPNMANISGQLNEDIKQFQRDTNGHKGKIEVEAPESGVLEVSPSNQTLQGLVEYSSLGGGQAAIKIKGLKREIKTSKSIRKIEIQEIEINSTKELKKLLKSLEP